MAQDATAVCVHTRFVAATSDAWHTAIHGPLKRHNATRGMGALILSPTFNVSSSQPSRARPSLYGLYLVLEESECTDVFQSSELLASKRIRGVSLPVNV